jgi:hypothetical protein
LLEAESKYEDERDTNSICSTSLDFDVENEYKNSEKQYYHTLCTDEIEDMKNCETDENAEAHDEEEDKPATVINHKFTQK